MDIFLLSSISFSLSLGDGPIKTGILSQRVGGGGGGSGGAKVLGKLPVPGRSTNLDYGIVLAVGAGGGCLDIFFSHLSLSFLSPSL